MTTSLFQTCLIGRHQIIIMQATEGRRWYTYLPQVRGLMMHSMLCDVCCVICHADDSYYSGAAVVLTDMMHCSSSTTFHHPPSTIIRAADQRLARLHVVHSALRADRGVGLAALGPGPYCLAGEILLGGF